MKNPIEKTAMALAIAFIIALVVSALSRLDFTIGMPVVPKVAYWLVTAITLTVRIGCGWWLYQKTKPKQQYPWLWCLLGAVFGLVTIATYYIVEIYKKVSTSEENREET